MEILGSLCVAIVIAAPVAFIVYRFIDRSGKGDLY